MNDKQVGELEGILAAEKPAAAPIVIPATASKPAQTLPPLSHIENVPINVNMPGSTAAPVQLRPAPNSQAPSPVKAKASSAPPSEPQPPGKPKPPFHLESIETLQRLTEDSLRTYDWQSIVLSIKISIEHHGYFPILQLIEASLLYESYILSGKDQFLGEALATEAVDAKPNRLTQAEFEFMTDLLSNMRFNRL
jgi:hypothetical protein